MTDKQPYNFHVLSDGPRGQRNVLCNWDDCTSKKADWYNWGSYGWYCEAHAELINWHNRPDILCSLNGETAQVNEALTHAKWKAEINK